MALVFVIGVPGTGKSATCGELKRRGHLARDTDGDGFSGWRHRATGVMLRRFVDATERDQAFNDEYEWITDVAKVRALAEQANAEGRTAFLFGTSSNENEIWPLAAKVFCLAVDDDTLRHRLLTRTNNDYGKSELELGWCLAANAVVPKQVETYGATILDATRPVEEVAEELLALTETA